MFRIGRLLGFMTVACALHAAVKLPALISDHMVLQQGMPVRIWGAADPGESVKVDFQGQSVTVTAAANGKWTAWLKPLVSAGPLEMTINNSTIKDVLVGEVWLGSGQSNMEFRLQTAVNHDEEIARADYPMIHLFQVKQPGCRPAGGGRGRAWQVCSPASVKGFSAVEYFFGRHLQQNLHVPMGLIESDWGGTPAQSWTSKEALQSDPALKYVGDYWDKVLADYPAAKERYDATTLAAWNKAVEEAKAAGKTPPNRPGAPQGPGHPNTPAGLYNGMIAPLVPYGIRGAIWYQGESNASEREAYKYRRLFGAMIQDWRNRWGQGDFPFLFVQLANYKSNAYWPVLRESQTETLRLANTAMARDHRHRRIARHPSEEQAGRGTAAGTGGTRPDLQTAARVFGTDVPYGDARERSDARLPDAQRRHAGARRRLDHGLRDRRRRRKVRAGRRQGGWQYAAGDERPGRESGGRALCLGRRPGVQSGESGGPAGEPVPQRSAALPVEVA